MKGNEIMVITLLWEKCDSKVAPVMMTIAKTPYYSLCNVKVNV
jgi:hypothetical protein